MKTFKTFLLSEKISNTAIADVNEILLGLEMVDDKWSKFADSGDAKKQLKKRKDEIGPDEFLIRSEQAKVMADKVRAWAKENNFKLPVKKAWWTARPNALSNAVGEPVDSRKNPTDTLIQFADGIFLGLSAKSTKAKADIGFKNPGLGTVEKDLKLSLKGILEKEEVKFIKKHKLSDSKSARKKEIRADQKIANDAQKVGEKVLAKIRDEFLTKLESMKQKEVRVYLLTAWMDSGLDLFPKFIKVTGQGKKPPFGAVISDPLKNNKAARLACCKISFVKVGVSGIGVIADKQKIFRMRSKFESQKMASSIKFSGEKF